MPNPFSYNILVTLDRNYLPVLRVMLHSLSQSDPEGDFTVYAVHNSLTEQDLQRLHALFPRVHPVSVKVPEGLLAGAPVFGPLPHRDVLPAVCRPLPAAAARPHPLSRPRSGGAQLAAQAV